MAEHCIAVGRDIDGIHASCPPLGLDTGKIAELPGVVGIVTYTIGRARDRPGDLIRASVEGLPQTGDRADILNAAAGI